MYGNQLVCHWSKAQSTIALSSGEGEVNACVKGMSEGIGVYELISEICKCDNPNIPLMTDSSVAKGTITRHGSGRIKHVTIKQLWIQEALKVYGVSIIKIPRSENFADLLTHQCNRTDYDEHLSKVGAIRP